jgi:dihydropteroate synthase
MLAGLFRENDQEPQWKGLAGASKSLSGHWRRIDWPQSVSTEEELRRVLPTLEAVASGSRYPIPISIDTSKAEVAKAAMECGAVIINDISSLQGDLQTGIEAARHGAALVLMHMRGQPINMQMMPPSVDILYEVDVWAREAVARAERCGVSADRIMLDPDDSGKAAQISSFYSPIAGCRRFLFSEHHENRS